MNIIMIYTIIFTLTLLFSFLFVFGVHEIIVVLKRIEDHIIEFNKIKINSLKIHLNSEYGKYSTDSYYEDDKSNVK